MKEIDEFKSREEWEEYLWKEFLENIEKASSKIKIADFLNNLLSDDEKKDLVRRWTTIILLKQKMTYREIGEILWISPSTISAIKKNIKNDNLSYQSQHSFNKNKKALKAKNMKGSPSKTIFDYWADYPWLPPRGKGRWKFLNMK